MVVTLERRFESVYNEGYLKGVLDGYNEAVNNAVKWLKEQSCCGYIEDVEIDKFIESFKQAMEED